MNFQACDRIYTESVMRILTFASSAFKKVQQTWTFQVLILPLVVGFGSAMLVSGCLKDGIQNITSVCVWGALNSTLVSFLTVIFSGHAPGSSDFKADGTPTAAPVLKELDDNVLLVKAKAAGPRLVAYDRGCGARRERREAGRAVRHNQQCDGQGCASQ